jgi:hypothetical protein
MKQSEFNIFVTNITAVTTQTFSLRCGEFGAAMSADESNEMPEAKFDLEEQHENFDYQSILVSGYRDMESLDDELNNAWQLLELDELEFDKLESLNQQLPDSLPNLTQRLTGEQLKQWISYCLDAPNDSPIFLLNQLVMNLFQVDSDIHDLIREAIASDNIEDLSDESENITAKHIRMEDLVTAAEIESFKVFAWLFSKSDLSEEQLVELLTSEGCIDDQIVFESIYKIVSPSSQQAQAVKLKAQAQDIQSVVQFLEQTALA